MNDWITRKKARNGNQNRNQKFMECMGSVKMATYRGWPIYMWCSHSIFGLQCWFILQLGAACLTVEIMSVWSWQVLFGFIGDFYELPNNGASPFHEHVQRSVLWGFSKLRQTNGMFLQFWLLRKCPSRIKCCLENDGSLNIYRLVFSDH